MKPRMLYTFLVVLSLVAAGIWGSRVLRPTQKPLEIQPENKESGEVTDPDATVGKRSSKGTSTTKAHEERKPECFVVTYKHQKTSGHDSEESCLQHRNLLVLPHEKVNSLCVRANNVPVRFERSKKKTNEIVLAPVAGPDVVLTASYCTGESKCPDPCVIPKDDFMDALGGADGDSGQVAKWDSGAADDKEADVAAHLDTEMQNELNRLDRVDRSIFAGWKGNSTAKTCGVQQARR